jgi:hypothetical protein
MVSIGLLAGALAALSPSESSCAVSPKLAPPPVGLSVEFKFGSGGVAASGSETVQAVAPPGATFVQALDLPDGTRVASPSRSSIFGIFPLEGSVIRGSKKRSQTYLADPASLLAGLTPGKTVTLPFRETFDVNGKSHKRDAAAEATFLGCSSIDIGGNPEPVSIYRVSMSTMVLSGEKKKRVAPRQSEAVFSISQNYGWRLREEGSDGVLEVTEIAIK